ncbi:MAG TPA: ATP-binding protein, partial [Candidatus Hydrogenedentes bacterium]|nr:ATP-binding protein [Candidatus Hydrogenedentota bacterium]
VAPGRLDRVVVAVDPTCTRTGDEAGIVVCGKCGDHYYVIADLSLKASPDVWAKTAVDAFILYEADRIVYETNQGGEMVEHTIRTVDRHVPLRSVHASRGKITRAEPVAALAEQHRIHHVGMFPKLEDELCSFTGKPGQASPNRLDAFVYAITELHKRAPATVTAH